MSKNGQETALVTRQMGDTLTVAEHLAQSGFFQDARQVSQAVAKVLAGQELGFGPVASMTGIHIIQNKVALSANILGAAIKRHPAYNYRVKVLTDQECSIVFYEHGEEVGVSTFTMDDAQAAGLSGRDNWKKYPRNMLFARAMSNGARWHCPDVGAGAPIYTPDELGADVDADGGVIPGQYIEVEQEPLPQVVVSEDSVLWALNYKSAKGTPFWKAGGTLAECEQAWQRILDNRQRVKDEGALEAAMILLHEDAQEWLPNLWQRLEADEHAANENGAA